MNVSSLSLKTNFEFHYVGLQSYPIQFPFSSRVFYVSIWNRSDFFRLSRVWL